MKTKTTKRTTGKRLPDDACPRCGKKMREARGTFTWRVNEEEIKVSSIEHLRCTACGERVTHIDEVRRLRETAQDIYRARHGFLSAQEIRAIRERLGLIQAEFAKILRLGGTTLSRWEANRGVQSAVMDMLLRLIRDVPENLTCLRKRAA